MSRVKHYTLYLLVGALSYWVPDILVQWLHLPKSIWIFLLTFFVPTVVGVTWFLLSRKVPHSGYPVGLPLSMLLGIWMLGPLAMAIGTLPSGGTFLEPDQLESFLVIWAAFPMTTFMMATYSGSLGGVGLATLTLVIAAIASGIKLVVSRRKFGQDFPV
jgi:hypothetical protein